MVGGGFTGLWAALLAAERDPGRRVVLVEASRIGEGASGRNGGFADPSITHGIPNGLYHFAEEMEPLVALGRENFRELHETLERHGVDAHYDGNGKLEVAAAAHWVEALREHHAVLRRFGEDASWLDRDAARDQLDSPTYHAAVWHRSGGVLDPGRLCFGLRDAAQRLGVCIHEGAPVKSLVRKGSRIELRLPGGRLRAPKVVIATNAYCSPLRRMRRAVIPVWDYALVTEPLSAAQRDAIRWKEGQGVGDSSNQFHYYRLTRDGRILWGGYDAIYHYGSAIGPELEQRAATFERLSRHFFETFPQLAGLRFSHVWGGPIATTTRFCLDSGSAFGGRVAWSIGYTGLGVGASRFGARVALDRLDHPESPTLRLRLVRKRAFPWPPEPLRYLVVQLTRWELARADRNEGSRGPWLRLLDRLGLGFDS